MTDHREGALKNLTRSQLADWIADTESIIGPLTAIDCAADGTVGTFDIDGDPVEGGVEVVPDPSGAAECADPGDEVCRGKAYISNNCTAVLICRLPQS